MSEVLGTSRHRRCRLRRIIYSAPAQRILQRGDWFRGGQQRQAARPDHRGFVCMRSAKLADQAGLSNPALAGQEHTPTVPVANIIQQRVDELELASSPHHWPGYGRPEHDHVSSVTCRPGGVTRPEGEGRTAES
jgi:hypothetical protein